MPLHRSSMEATITAIRLLERQYEEHDIAYN